MRTTLAIDDALLARVKDRAGSEGVTAGRVVEEALQHFLALPPPERPTPLPVFEGGGGLRPGVDPSSNAALREAAGDPDLERAGLQVNVLDVNVLLALHRGDHPHHDRASAWWDRSAAAGESFTVPDGVWVGFCRLATDGRVFVTPAGFEQAWDFVQQVRAQPTYLEFVSDPRVLDHFARIANATAARGGLLPDVHLAAVAASFGATVVTFDRDFRKFDGVRVVEPD